MFVDRMSVKLDMGNMKEKKKNSKTSPNQVDAKEQKEQFKKTINTKKLRGNILFGIGIAGIIILFAFGLWKLSGEEKNPANVEVFTVGNEIVYLNEVNLCMLQNVSGLGITREHLDGTTAEDGQPVDSYYVRQIMEMIMNYKVESMIAQKEGITLSQEEEDSVVADAVSYITKMNGHALKELGIDQDLIIEVYRQRYLAKALEDKIAQELDVEEQKYCTLYVMMFPKVHMLEDGNVATAEDGVTPIQLSEEEMNQRKENADAAYQELKDGGEFLDIATKYEVSSYSGEQSNLTGNFEEPFLEYAQTLKEGDFSPVIETESFYAIVIMVTENNEELASQIMEYYRSDLMEESLEERRQAWYQELGIDKNNIQYTDVYEELTLYKFVE